MWQWLSMYWCWVVGLPFSFLLMSPIMAACSRFGEPRGGYVGGPVPDGKPPLTLFTFTSAEMSYKGKDGSN